MLTPIYAHLENTFLCTLLLKHTQLTHPNCNYVHIRSCFVHGHIDSNSCLHLSPAHSLTKNANTVDLATARANVHIRHYAFK